MTGNKSPFVTYFSQIFEETALITKRKKYYYETCMLTSSNPSKNRLYYKTLQNAIKSKGSFIKGVSKASNVWYVKSNFEKDIIYTDYKGNIREEREKPLL